MEWSTSKDITILSHSDLTAAEFKAALRIVSVGIFRNECFAVHLLAFLKNTCLVHAEMKLDDWSKD